MGILANAREVDKAANRKRVAAVTLGQFGQLGRLRFQSC